MADKKEMYYNGEKYESISKLADAIGVKRSTLSMALNKEATVEEAIAKVTKKDVVVTYDGKGYSSYKELADAYGINASTLNNRLIDGMSLEEALTTPVKPRSKPITYNGVDYDSKTALANAFGLDANTFKNREMLGWDLDTILSTALGEKATGRATELTFRGVDFNSYRKLTETYCVEYGTFMQRINLGWSIEEALGLEEVKEAVTVTK